METLSLEDKAIAAKRWDAVAEGNPLLKRFWQIPACVRHMNKLMGIDSPMWAAGLHEQLKARPKAKTAIAIGCGIGIKESRLLQLGFVEHFDLFEISEERVKKGREMYAARKLADRATFSLEDGFIALRSNRYDMVHWDGSLHHMPNVHEVLELSHAALNPGGIIVVNEFVGPNRFQWPDRQLAIVNKFRKSLPDRFFFQSFGARIGVSRLVARPTIEHMLATDPSESIDSEAILPAIRELFPKAPVWMLGGVIYHIGLNDVLANFDLPNDQAILDVALLLDEVVAEMGESHFAASIITKD